MPLLFDGTDIHLKLRPQPTPPGEPDPVVRLRCMLKDFLRSHGFRCVDYREVPRDEPLRPAETAAVATMEPTTTPAEAGQVKGGQ